jgi:hypothetical protein
VRRRVLPRFQRILTEFEPATEGQKIRHAETLQAYNQMIEARRMRPFRGDMGIEFEPYELIYDRLMRPTSEG